MTIRRSLLLAGALTLALALPAVASAVPTAVDVRIEGKTSTIFDGPVTTDGKTVTTAAGGTHVCDGTNAGATVSPGPTPTTALDDAAIKGGFTWDGAWFGTDFFASRIAGDTEDNDAFQYWGVMVDGVLTLVGGCQMHVRAGQEVVWVYDRFNKVGGLALAGSTATQPGREITLHVMNLESKAPIAGAQVGGATTDGNGVARLTFAEKGIYRLKAERPDFVRSRALTVCVDPPGADECTSGDETAPKVRLDAPKLASRLSRLANRIPLSWQGDDGDGSGIKRYRVEVRRAGAPDTAWRLLRGETASTKGHLNANDGVTYDLRVRAYDRANNASPPATARTVVPFDNLSDGIGFSQHDWKVLRRHGAWERTVSRVTQPGASASLRFTGSGATIVTRKLPNGGRVRVSVDGKSKIVSLRGKGRFRKRLIGTGKLEPGQHTLRVTSLDRAPVEIDAIAVRP